MGPGWVVCIKILYRIGAVAPSVHLAVRADVSLAKITKPDLKSWKLIYHGPSSILFCCLELTDCHFLTWQKQWSSNYNLRRNKDHCGGRGIVLLAGPSNGVDESFCSEAFAVLQPTWVLVSKSRACICMTPLVLLFHSKTEKKKMSWSWQSHGDGRSSSVLYNSTGHCKVFFSQIAVFFLLGDDDRYLLLFGVLLWTATVISQPCLTGISPGHSISSTQTVNNNLHFKAEWWLPAITSNKAAKLRSSYRSSHLIVW